MAFSVTILGNSGAIPTSTRHPTSMLLNMNYKFFLIDCGEGTQIQLRKYKFKIQKINRIFISHLHGDHFFGLVGLISSQHLLGRQEALHIYADSRIREIIDLQMEISDTRLRFPIEYHPTDPEKPETVYEDDEHYVKTFPLEHSVPTTGFLFAEKQRPRKIRKDFVKRENPEVEDILKIKSGADYVNQSGKFFNNKSITIAPPKPRSFAFCSDTRYGESIIPYIKNVDLLYHEASFLEDMASVAAEKYHATAGEAAQIAKQASVEKLMIGHFSARYKTLETLLNEAREIFPQTVLAEEGKTFKIARK